MPAPVHWRHIERRHVEPRAEISGTRLTCPVVSWPRFLGVINNDGYPSTTIDYSYPYSNDDYPYRNVLYMYMTINTYSLPSITMSVTLGRYSSLPNDLTSEPWESLVRLREIIPVYG